MNVENFTSNKGNIIPNQFIIRTAKGVYFQSYKSLIAFIPNKVGAKIQIGKDWKYSKTTGKYRNQFLDETKKETQQKLDNKTYLLKTIKL